jgi:hypothetical protein
MLPFGFPYPGFSWSMTQHVGPATKREVMYELLQAAHIYANDPKHADRITARLVERKLLTPNIRQDAGRPQTWRDYQQVLAELGLIISTRFTDRVIITPAGLMWLDGILGYSELMTTQCLRYQYPNGHKQDISPTLRTELESQKISIPLTRTELDASFDVLIKPAVLILRILLQLMLAGDTHPRLSDEECLVALVPTKKNADWPGALDRLLCIRQTGVERGDIRRLRHIQEWFRLLSLCDIFDLSRFGIGLSPVATQNSERLIQLCDYHENIESFWIAPTDDAHGLALSWFDYYGNPDIESEWLVPEELKDLEYLKQNYPGGVEEPEEWEVAEKVVSWVPEIKLHPFQEQPTLTLWQKGEVDAERIARGHLRRQRSTRLHQQIVELLAKKLQQKGYATSEDPLSVDLLAAKADSEAIIEVKTVTPRTISNRMRLGVGQLLEYRYRRQIQQGREPVGVLVVSSHTSFPNWFTEYFEADIHLGLISRISSEKFVAHTSGEFERMLT